MEALLFILFMLLLLGTFAGIPIAYAIGNDAGKREIREKAVEAGAGRWCCDPLTGETEFFFPSPTEAVTDD